MIPVLVIVPFLSVLVVCVFHWRKWALWIQIAAASTWQVVLIYIYEGVSVNWPLSVLYALGFVCVCLWYQIRVAEWGVCEVGTGVGVSVRNPLPTMKGHKELFWKKGCSDIPGKTLEKTCEVVHFNCKYSLGACHFTKKDPNRRHFWGYLLEIPRAPFRTHFSGCLLKLYA